MLLKDAAPNLEYDLSRALAPNRGVYGPDQVRGTIEEFVGSWTSVRIEPREFIAIGPHVVVPGTARFTGRDGIKVKSRIAWTFTIRDGEIERICMYHERHSKRPDYGLSRCPLPAEAVAQTPSAPSRRFR